MKRSSPESSRVNPEEENTLRVENMAKRINATSVLEGDILWGKERERKQLKLKAKKKVGKKENDNGGLIKLLCFRSLRPRKS